jgi:hypothetical protein
VELFQRIGEQGVCEEFQGMCYRYYCPGDGYKYWRMTDDITQSRHQLGRDAARAVSP